MVEPASCGLAVGTEERVFHPCYPLLFVHIPFVNPGYLVATRVLRETVCSSFCRYNAGLWDDVMNVMKGCCIFYGKRNGSAIMCLFVYFVVDPLFKESPLSIFLDLIVCSMERASFWV